MIQQVAAVLLGWRQAPSLDTKMTYESKTWVPLDSYCKYWGCYLGRREGVLAAYSHYSLICHSLGEHALQVNGP